MSQAWRGPFWERFYRFISQPYENSLHFVGNWGEHLKNWNAIKDVKHISYESLLIDPLIRFLLHASMSASRFDPGPNHILESIACQIPTYVASDGGGAVEFAGKDHAFEDLDQLFRIIRSRSYVNNSLSIK